MSHTQVSQQMKSIDRFGRTRITHHDRPSSRYILGTTPTYPEIALILGMSLWGKDLDMCMIGQSAPGVCFLCWKECTLPNGTARGLFARNMVFMYIGPLSDLN